MDAAKRKVALGRGPEPKRKPRWVVRRQQPGQTPDALQQLAAEVRADAKRVYEPMAPGYAPREEAIAAENAAKPLAQGIGRISQWLRPASPNVPIGKCKCRGGREIKYPFGITKILNPKPEVLTTATVRF